MPTYDYYCSACQQDIEVFQSIKDAVLDVCPECNKKGKIRRMISSGAGIIFKGSGFYETDYKSKKPQAEQKLPKEKNSKQPLEKSSKQSNSGTSKASTNS